jgi:hypothetical protein
VKLSLDINAFNLQLAHALAQRNGGCTFLQQDSLQKGILVAKHEALVGGIAVAILQVLQRLFMVFYRGLKLLDVLGAPFAKGSLSLTVALFALLRGCVYLETLG